MWRLARNGSAVSEWEFTRTWSGGTIINYDVSPWIPELLLCRESNSSACRLEVKSPSANCGGAYNFSKISVTLQVYDIIQ